MTILIPLLRVARLAALALLVTPVLAQTPPDAGRLLRDTDSTLKPLPPQQRFRIESPEAPPPARADDARRVTVKAFRFEGNAAIPSEELAAVVASYAGREVSFAELEQAVAAISNHYRGKGYFLARAYLPVQAIRDGIVIVQVLEGRLGKVVIDIGPGLGLRPDFVRDSLQQGLKSGDVVSTQGLERVILSLNELAGYDVRASFSPGEETGVSDITLRVTDTAFVSGNLFMDNFGNRYSGELRAGGAVALNNLTGHGDRLSFRGVRSVDQGVGILAYETPVGTRGARLGVNGSYLDYALCCAFSPLRIEGKARTVAATGSYPLLLTRVDRVTVQAGVDHKRFDNTSLGINVSSRRVNVGNVTVSGEHRLVARDGLATWSLGLAGGRADLSGNAADFAADAATAQTQGSYGKASFGGTVLWPLSQRGGLFVAGSGQIAGKNLDSSEKFVLGGPQGVRGYPVGEASGDSGVLATAEYRYLVRENLQVAGFLDGGYIQLHNTLWAGWQGANANLRNSYGLASTGLVVTYAAGGRTELKAIFAAPVGANRGADVNGLNSDGRGRERRLWLTAAMVF